MCAGDTLNTAPSLTLQHHDEGGDSSICVSDMAQCLHTATDQVTGNKD